MKQKWEVTTVSKQGEEPAHHFFVSSVAEWRIGYDVAELIKYMKAQGFPFNVWLVPGVVGSDYRIEYYSPQVEGSRWLAFYGVKK